MGIAEWEQEFVDGWREWKGTESRVVEHVEHDPNMVSTFQASSSVPSVFRASSSTISIPEHDEHSRHRETREAVRLLRRTSSYRRWRR